MIFFSKSNQIFQLEVLGHAVKTLQKEIIVYVDGIDATQEDINIIKAHINALEEAIVYCMTTSVIVSLNENKRMKEDIVTLKLKLKEKRNAITNFNDILKKKHKTLERTLIEIQTLQTQMAGAKLLPFKRKNDFKR